MASWRLALLLLTLSLTLVATSSSVPTSQDKPEIVGAVNEPVCVGWDGGWMVYRYSMDKGRWLSWKSPPAPLPRFTAFTAVGPRAAVVLDPARKYSGWLFDLAASKWKGIPESPVPGPDGIWDPIVVSFADRQLVFWGYSKGPPHGAVLDLATFKWRAMPETPIALRFRALHATIRNKLMFWGGYPNLLQNGGVFDLTGHTWERLPDAPIKFSTYMVSAIWRDRFVVFGGRTGEGAVRKGAIYDPIKRSWDRMADAPFDVGIMSACAVSGDQLFLWSGQAAPPKAAGSGQVTPAGALYDFGKREWSKIPEAPIAPRNLAFARAVGKQVVVWGGWVSGSNQPPRFLRDGAIYDLDKRTWKRIPDLPGEVPMALHPGW
ncbi:MAG: hypothetical protein L0Z62_42730 [Gemmataceae bacterium]|nr:hypothetical protein [Gemmataceae bacterium]